MQPPRQLRVVAMGGGTGLSTLLRGMKRYVAAPTAAADTSRRTAPAIEPICKDVPCLIRELSAIVTVTDDGGSSGRLREDLNMLPPGDVRNCIVALSEDEHLLSQLFQYRFDQGALGGHSFGNLFLAALTGITSDFAQAVQMSSQILAARGRIYPSTIANATLKAKMDDGSIVRGETSISASKQSIVELMLEPARNAGRHRRRRPHHPRPRLALHIPDLQPAGGRHPRSARQRKSHARLRLQPDDAGQ
jgi:2-phospho-L-lactate transferase/gluconeogenesis factor (CofD/UPF0052 family)